MVAFRICVLVCARQQNNFQIKVFLSRQFQSYLAIYNRCFLYCSGGYVFHYCTWDSGKCNEKLIQHQNRNYKLKTIFEYVSKQMI